MCYKCDQKNLRMWRLSRLGLPIVRQVMDWQIRMVPKAPPAMPQIPHPQAEKTERIQAPMSKLEAEELIKMAGFGMTDIEEVEEVLRQITNNLTIIKRLVRGPRGGPSVPHIKKQLIFRAKRGSEMHYDLAVRVQKILVKTETSLVQVQHLGGGRVEGHPFDIRNLLRGTGYCDSSS